MSNTNSQIKQCKERGAMPINIGERRVDDAKNGNWHNVNKVASMPLQNQRNETLNTKKRISEKAKSLSNALRANLLRRKQRTKNTKGADK